MLRANWSIGVAAAGLLLCLAAAVEAAPWLQYGVTGDSYTTDPGPLTNDTAWTMRLSGSRAAVAWPLIINGSAYVLEAAHPLTMPGSVNQVHRISLETGESTSLTGVLPQHSFTWASDGHNLYLAGRDSIQVVRLADGARVAEWAYPDVPIPQRGPNVCIGMVVELDALYVLCMASGNQVPGASEGYSKFGRPFSDGPTLAEDNTIAYPFVASYSIPDGDLRWRFFIDVPATAEQTPPHPLVAEVLSLSGSPQVTFPTGLSVFDDHVAISGMHVTGFRDDDYGDHEGHCFLYLVDENTGSLVKRFSSLDEDYRATAGSGPDDLTSCGLAGEPRWDPERRVVFGKFQRAFVINLRGDYTYAGFHEFGDGPEEVGSGAAYDGRRLFMSSYKRISQFDAALAETATSFQIPEADEAAFADYSPILTNDTLYAMAHHDENNAWNQRSVIYALRPGGPEVSLRWKMEVPHPADSAYGFNHLMSIGEGMMVIAGMDGSVTALGTTAQSPVAVARILGDVKVGRPFRVDLSDSKPGLQGPPTAFRAEWGDGTTTEWQSEPVMEHTYAGEPLDGSPYVARFQVRNEAGQTSSSFVPLLGTVVSPTDGNGIWPWLASAGGLLLVFLVGLILVTRQRVARIALLVKGRSADRFTVIRELGRGSFGVAQLARDNKLGRDVVLKQPYGSFGTTRAERERFLEEARVAARVHHPNVVTVFEVIPEEEPPVMVLEYVPGGSLEQRLKQEGPIATQEARQLTLDLLQGLAAIHAAGIIHRDLKPANVLLDADGRAKVSDFGVAQVDDRRAAEETRARGAMGPGTLAYMSPELLRGQAATPASDQYAAAAIAFRLFAGHHHADGADWSSEAIRQRILVGKPRVGARGIPPAIRPILRRALAQEPGARYPDVKTFMADMAAASLSEGEPR